MLKDLCTMKNPKPKKGEIPDFSAANYKGVYKRHIKALTKIFEANRMKLVKILVGLFKDLR